MQCPSARMEVGAGILGTFAPDGRLVRFDGGFRVTDSFIVNAATVARPPEQRFRFYGRCVEGACSHWKSERCNVPQLARVLVGGHADELIRLQPCPIRASCRWFAQDGRGACELCDYVVTDPRGYLHDEGRLAEAAVAASD